MRRMRRGEGGREGGRRGAEGARQPIGRFKEREEGGREGGGEKEVGGKTWTGGEEGFCWRLWREEGGEGRRERGREGGREKEREGWLVVAAAFSIPPSPPSLFPRGRSKAFHFFYFCLRLSVWVLVSVCVYVGMKVNVIRRSRRRNRRRRRGRRRGRRRKIRREGSE